MTSSSQAGTSSGISGRIGRPEIPASRRDPAWQMTSTTTSSSSGREPGAGRSGTGSPRTARRCSGWSEGRSCHGSATTGQTEAVFVRGKYLAPEVWYDRHGREFQPEVNYYVGGNTKFYGAALFRLRPEDFGELRHHGGISPAWPISYDDLEPYYTQAEHLYLVHGEHGEDPTRGPGQRAVRLPAGVPRTPHPAAERRPGEARAAPVPPADRGQPPGGGAGPSGPGERLHPLRPGRRLPVPAGRQVGLAGHLRGSGAVPGQRHAGHRRQRAAPGDRRLRAHGHRGRHDPGRRIRRPPSPATSWWSPAAR